MPGALSTTGDPSSDAALGRAIGTLYEAAAVAPPWAFCTLAEVVGACVGADGTRLFVADYGLRRLQELGPDGLVGTSLPIQGSIASRAFDTGAVVATGVDPTVLRVPLVNGTERIGLLELRFSAWDGTVPVLLAPLVRTLAALFATRGRSTDAWVRARRAEPLSAAAEVQWDLLPPLAGEAHDVAVAGILEPAYSIGGDSFDYAFNDTALEFAIIDAVGHGMPAVVMAAGAINGLRNVRREQGGLAAAYQQVDALVTSQFGKASTFVTGQVGTLDHGTGVLTWLNAGHVPPLLVRNGTYAGQLACAPSLPMGLGGEVVEIAREQLQGGDRVLFYTDGITESRSHDGEFFGLPRLADYLVRATLEGATVGETVRRLSANVLAFVAGGLRDDATMFLIECRIGQASSPPEPPTAP